VCGIVGYVGQQSALHVVIEGLRRLEYRGYDSAGVALVDAGATWSAKRAGKLSVLEKSLVDEDPPEATLGIGHTRWATHGPPTDVNAHPHLDCSGKLAVVHNGILENFASLRLELERSGHDLTSETDTEVVAHLLEDALPAAAGDLARRCAGCVVGWTVRSPWLPQTPTTPPASWEPDATPRWSSDVATARTSSPPTSPPSSPTRATRSSSDRTKWSWSPATRCR
jgi:glucosamine--fructose-6-phosphate aminotransferase (isomerizing)